jgi:hypothetical protein
VVQGNSLLAKCLAIRKGRVQSLSKSEHVLRKPSRLDFCGAMVAAR